MTTYVSLASICASTGITTPKHCGIIKPNLELSHDNNATNEITYNNSRPRLPQCAITSEVGHT
jgi:hypothetical protein